MSIILGTNNNYRKIIFIHFLLNVKMENLLSKNLWSLKVMKLLKTYKIN